MRARRDLPRQLRRFVTDPYFRERLVPRIDGLADDPRPDGCKKLAGHDNRYRIRVGDLRIVYHVDDDQAGVLVLVIGHRREVYARNADPKPFRWTKTAEDILASIERFCRRTLAVQTQCG